MRRSTIHADLPYVTSSMRGQHCAQARYEHICCSLHSDCNTAWAATGLSLNRCLNQSLCSHSADCSVSKCLRSHSVFQQVDMQKCVTVWTWCITWCKTAQESSITFSVPPAASKRRKCRTSTCGGLLSLSCLDTAIFLHRGFSQTTF